MLQRGAQQMPTDDDDGFWVSVSEAARRLGCSRQAVQKRIGRGTIPTKVNNRGERLVKAVAGSAPVSSAPVPVTSEQPSAPVHLTEPLQALQDKPASIPVSVYREAVEALRHAHAAALQDQVEQLRADMAKQAAQHRTDLESERTRHDAQTARQLAELDALHQDTLQRIAAQAGIERSLLLERIDAAEVRAERVEQRLDQVLDALLAERRQVAENRPWWRRWFRSS
jgi:Skp family chaperone for outer membrane proteins